MQSLLLPEGSQGKGFPAAGTSPRRKWEALQCARWWAHLMLSRADLGAVPAYLLQPFLLNHPGSQGTHLFNPKASRTVCVSAPQQCVLLCEVSPGE